MLQLIKGLPADKRYQTIRNMDEQLQKNQKLKENASEALAEAVHDIIDDLPLLESVKAAGKLAVSGIIAAVDTGVDIVGNAISKILDFFCW